MKNIVFTLGLLFSMMLSLASLGQNKHEVEYEQLIEMIGRQNFIFEAQRVSPQGGRQIDVVGDNYTLKITEEEAEAFLPFFGRAFTGSYGDTEGGIKFKELMQNVEFKKNDKKHRVIFKFTVRSPKDTYDCTLNISRGGFATLSINSQKKSSISYTGRVYEADQENE
ncbi:DUF4251 domain-containing protein [Sediminitomix flava]|nr:DUF4251 domain-containing protein [Sediminitomix flava]